MMAIDQTLNIGSDIVFKIDELHKLYEEMIETNKEKLKSITIQKNNYESIYDIERDYSEIISNVSELNEEKLNDHLRYHVNPYDVTICIRFSELDKLFILSLYHRSNNNIDQIINFSKVTFPDSYCTSTIKSNVHFLTFSISPKVEQTSNHIALMNKYRAYYKEILYQLEKKKDIESMKVRLDIYKQNFRAFNNIVLDEGLLIIPITGKTKSIKSLVVEVEKIDNIRQTFSYTFRDVSAEPPNKEDKSIYTKMLSDNGVSLPEDVSLCVLMVNENESDKNQIISVITNEKTTNCKISEDVIGEKKRVQKIINSISNIIDEECVNPLLTGIICSNEITGLLEHIGHSFCSDLDFVKSLKTKYPKLENNLEQCIAIEKILTMEENKTPLMLVQGPPGTGKTEIILTLIKELTDSGKNILISSNVHVACNNIIERSKNSKELIFKRYTSLNNSDKYEEELLQNQRRYISNQVFSGFVYKDVLIDDTKVLEKMNDDLLKLENDIIHMESMYSAQSKDFVKYQTITNKIESKFNEIRDVELEIKEHENNIELCSLEIKSNRKKILENKDTVENLLFKDDQIQKENCDISSNIDSLNEKIAAHNHKKIDLHTEMKSLQEIVSKPDIILQSLVNQLDIEEKELEEVSNIDLDIECANFVKCLETKSEWNSLLPKYLRNEICEIERVRALYDILSRNTDFWKKNILNKELLDEIWFRKASLFLSNSTLEIQTSIELYYEYSILSNLQKIIRNVMPRKGENFTRRNIQYHEQLLLQYFKEVQYDYKKTIESAFASQVIKEKLNNLFESKFNLTSNLKKRIDNFDQEKNAALSNISKLQAEISMEEKEVIKLEKTILEYKVKIDRNLDEKTKIKNKCNSIQVHSNNLYKTIDENNKKIIILSNELDSWTKKNMHELTKLESLEREIEIEKVSCGEPLAAFISFKKKYNIEINAKKIEYTTLEATINNYLLKVKLLENNGTMDTIGILHEYAKELSRLQTIDDDGLKPHLNGKGRIFKDSFMIDSNKKGNIISMTTNQVSQLLDKDTSFYFDYAFIDESSKCQFEDIVIALPRVKNLVLIGDYMQLPPIFQEYEQLDEKFRALIEEKHVWEQLNGSPFSMLLEQVVRFNEQNNIGSFHKNPLVSALNRQFRMNKGIFSLVDPIYRIHKGFEIIDEKKTEANDVLCIEIKGREESTNKSYKNVDEIKFVVDLLININQKRELFPHVKSIGVITGYRKQSDELRNAIHKKVQKKIDGLEIGTIDNFQGREYDLVIVSMVRTERLGFLSEVRRMNVALSRARCHMIIVGNFEKIYDCAQKEKAVLSSNTNYSLQRKREMRYVLDELIPSLHSLKRNHLSDEHRLTDVQKFLMENTYD